jgi:hypothetical protein
MSKKLIAACMVIAAFAVVPSLAAAKPVLTHPTGTIIPPGTPLLATNTTETVMTLPGELPPLKCSSAVMTGTVTADSTAGGFDGEITKAEFGGTGTTISGDVRPECTGGLGPSGVTVTSLPWCLEGTESSDTFSLKGGKCGAATAPITFDLTVTSAFGTITCKYIRTTKLTGTFQTHPSDAIASIASVVFTKHESSVLCPEKGELDMTFTVETDSPVAEPVYISS